MSKPPVAESASAAATAPERRGDRAHGLRMAVLVVGLALGFAAVPRLTRGCERVGGDEDAPDFTAAMVANAEPADATTVTLSALRGRPVVLDFWATWCGPCQAEAPIVNAIAQRFRDRGVVVLGVNTSDEPGLAERWAKRKGVSFPIVYDDGNSIAHKYGVENLPTLIVVSKTGKIAAIRHGVTSASDLERLVKQVL